ncbi:head decoration protein [Niveispirillum sp.]|uniref:head decoration protein n=1 Tax=Niveispirillum sp. TaxID=1917217 RepID=UPI001B3E9C51|nr:head decoration protein [Niveispirillum sp.]MBP7339418.1 head decoration protein [Niveispirillum sp.]
MDYVVKEPIRPGEHVISEANGSRSREEITVAAAADLGPATVLGKVTASGKYKRLAPAANDGTQTAAAVLYGDAYAETEDVKATAHLRDAEVNGLVLSWPTGITNNQKAAAVTQLTALGIIVRN